MGTPVPIKKRAHCAHRFPSFVYRQDGHELSYLFLHIIQANDPFVNKRQFLPLNCGNLFKHSRPDFVIIKKIRWEVLLCNCKSRTLKSIMM